MSDTCFVIMPFDKKLEEYYEKIYKVAIEESGLKAIRADDSLKAGIIMQDVLDNIKKSAIILADLNQLKPNVIYEVGLAHALKKRTVIVIPSFIDIPFDLSLHRFISYDVTVPGWSDCLTESIREAINETMLSIAKADEPYVLGYKIENEENEVIVDTSESDYKEDKSKAKKDGEIFVNPSLSELEAENLIYDMQQVGHTSKAICNVLLEHGVPQKWISRKI